MSEKGGRPNEKKGWGWVPASSLFGPPLRWGALGLESEAENTPHRTFRGKGNGALRHFRGMAGDLGDGG